MTIPSIQTLSNNIARQKEYLQKTTLLPPPHISLIQKYLLEGTVIINIKSGKGLAEFSIKKRKIAEISFEVHGGKSKDDTPAYYGHNVSFISLYDISIEPFTHLGIESIVLRNIMQLGHKLGCGGRMVTDATGNWHYWLYLKGFRSAEHPDNPTIDERINEKIKARKKNFPPLFMMIPERIASGWVKKITS